MVGTGEIKYPGRTKTSTVARQFGIELSRARGKKTLTKNTSGLPDWGLVQRTSSSLNTKKNKKLLKKPNTKQDKIFMYKVFIRPVLTHQ
jgi:hypothetical protein